MADVAPNASAAVADPPAPNGAALVVDRLEELTKSNAAQMAELKAMNEKLEKASGVQYPFGLPNGASGPGIISGESPNSSRSYSLMRYTRALAKKADGHSDWRDYAKTELQLAEKLCKAYEPMGYAGKGMLVPLGADRMPIVETETVAGEKLPGVPAELVKECRDLMADSGRGYDPNELKWIQDRTGVKLSKELSATTQNIGGTLVAFPGQGELIELLRPKEVFTRAGAAEIDLPPQGAIRFPRITGPASIAAYAENGFVAFSTPTTGQLILQAKAYSGIVDIPEELLKFATSVAVEAWLRMEFTLDMAKQTDRDMIYGNGGIQIQGVINYPNINLVIASSPLTNGDLFDANDPMRMFAAVADANAPVDRGFFYAMTNTLWAALTTRTDLEGRFMFSAAYNNILDGQKIGMNLTGYPVLGSTNVPTNRTKGSATTLTLVFGGVGPEWIIGRAGVIDLVVTNSDASKFQQRISTMRGTQFIDAGPRHEASFVFVDTLQNA
jgi:HK97 family phage major capsid protein